MTTDSAPGRPSTDQPAAESAALRADARRNRARLIEAAGRIFTEQGPDVAMEEIARAAGVGIGTLYRRFPDRAALIRAVAQDNFEQAVQEARRALDGEPTAWEALVRVVRHARELRLTVHLVLTSPRFAEVIKSDAATSQRRRELLDVLDEVVRAGQREGSLRGDVGAGDVAMLLVLLLRENPRGLDSGAGAERRMQLLLEGLRAEGPREGRLPGRPLGLSDLAL